MIKLYNRTASGGLQYHEAWIDGDEVVEHWGTVGDRGTTRRQQVDSTIDEDASLERVLAGPRAAGFEQILLEEHRVLLVEFAVQGMGTGTDVAKRHALEDRLNETLGWTGLGHCDGGSIGSGSMEACCFVVDYDVAKRTVEHDLRGTEFADYARVYEET